ncbi:MAG: YiiX/YebB-like N1pC/P60 family cysteine hydrolase, partial [Flammeovirgaceae bacterium]
MQVGDIVFICIDFLPFRKVAEDTGSWSNHVGIVVDMVGQQPVIAESTFPFSTTTTLDRFIKRSRDGRIAVYRLKDGLNKVHHDSLRKAAQKRMGIFYDSGFNLH